MFEMTESEIKAFSHGTSGISVSTYSHGIAFLLGTAATIWLTVLFIGIFKNKELSAFEALQKFAWGILVFMSVGILIYGV